MHLVINQLNSKQKMMDTCHSKNSLHFYCLIGNQLIFNIPKKILSRLEEWVEDLNANLLSQNGWPISSYTNSLYKHLNKLIYWVNRKYRNKYQREKLGSKLKRRGYQTYKLLKSLTSISLLLWIAFYMNFNIQSLKVKKLDFNNFKHSYPNIID